VRAREADEGLPRIPLFGGGDAYSSQDYWEKVDASGVDGVMVARGALIKPWVFTEIKERREWDISATERLELYRKVGPFFGMQCRTWLMSCLHSTLNMG
jgi:tRNA-dihydrouridine synthase 3